MKIAGLAMCVLTAVPVAAQQVPVRMPLVHRSGSLLIPGLPSMTALPLSSEAPASIPSPLPPGAGDEHEPPVWGGYVPALVVLEDSDDVYDSLAPSEIVPASADALPSAVEPTTADVRRHLEEDIARLEQILAVTLRELRLLDRQIARMEGNARRGVTSYEGGETLSSVVRRRDELAAMHEANLQHLQRLQRELRLVSR